MIEAKLEERSSGVGCVYGQNDLIDFGVRAFMCCAVSWRLFIS
jgi:hypothetical protein